MSSRAPTLQELREGEIASALDVHVARTLGRLAGETDPRVLVAAALACRAPVEGHVCVELRAPIDLGPVGPTALAWRWPEPEEWLPVLESSPLVGDGSTRTPLVLDAGGRLYLYRYFEYQARLATALRLRLASEPPPVDRAVLAGGLLRLFPENDSGRSNLQRLAALVAVRGRLAVISGGPGTGKTTTVTRILLLLAEQARARGAGGLRVMLLAPTGKAAARLAESVAAGRRRLNADLADLASLPDEASTVHRALGLRAQPGAGVDHDAENPLAADVVVVDEASMVDLSLMARLVEAVPPSAHLILLGDRDQLVSVEAGAILGDVCDADGPVRGYGAKLCADAASIADEELQCDSAVPAIRDHVVHLEHSYRFAADSGIRALASAVNLGDAGAAVAALRRGGNDLVWIDPASSDARAVTAALAERVVDGYATYLRAGSPADALARFRRFRILCAHRAGDFGVDGVNLAVRELLSGRGLLAAGGEWYCGRPVMVAENDYHLGLFNGDIGLTWPDSDGVQRVWFTGARDGRLRSYGPARLPAHETVFAMTVHKSQGSEFDEVLLMLPQRESRVLTRELIYTGVTRAMRRVIVHGDAELIATAIGRRVHRASGLRDALWRA